MEKHICIHTYKKSKFIVFQVVYMDWRWGKGGFEGKASHQKAIGPCEHVIALKLLSVVCHQVAYMEKLRSDKLMFCGIMIQKHVKGWLYRYKEAKWLTLQVQGVKGWFYGKSSTNGLIFVDNCCNLNLSMFNINLRRCAASHVFLKSFHRYNIPTFLPFTQLFTLVFDNYYFYRKKYRTTKNSVATIQRYVRGFLARRRARTLRRKNAATKLQAAIRGFIQVYFSSNFFSPTKLADSLTNLTLRM